MPKLRSQSTLITTMAVLLALARIGQLSQRTFYWDDMIIPARYSPSGLTSPDLTLLSLATLFQLHDGHLMPGSVLVQTAMHHLAPLQWWPVATLITIATAISFAAWIPVLRILTPNNQTWALAALGFSPFLMDAAGWWSAALNAYAWQLATAGTLYAILTRRFMFAAAALLTGLVFTEKAFTIVPIVLVVLWLRSRKKHPTPTATQLLPLFTVFAAWVILFVSLSLRHPRTTAGHMELLRDIPTALRDAIIPGTLGGPWTWSRWIPAKAFADPHPIAWTLALLVFTILIVFLIRRGATLALAAATAYLTIVFMLLVYGRDSAHTSGLILRSMHYYADWWTGTVLFVASASDIKKTRATAIFIISALLSTTTWTLAWRDDPTRTYLANLRNSDTQELLPQPTPLNILSPLAHPYNTIAAITGHPATLATANPRIIDESGTLVPAIVLPVAHTSQGPEPHCGHRITAGHSTIIDIDNPLPFGAWTWEMNTAATNPIELHITTPNGLEDPRTTATHATTLTVGPELTQRWVRVDGGGGKIKIDANSTSPTASICIGAGAIGPLVPAQ